MTSGPVSFATGFEVSIDASNVDVDGNGEEEVATDLSSARVVDNDTHGETRAVCEELVSEDMRAATDGELQDSGANGS